MTREDLVSLMRQHWLADPNSNIKFVDEQGIVSDPSAEQIAMINAQLGAIADGILEAIRQETPVAGAPWFWEVFAGTGTQFVLARTPISNTLTVYRNGLLELGWTLAGSTITLATSRLAGDADLRVHYQAVVPT